MDKKIYHYTIDFAGVEYYLQFHDVIRDSLDFPAYYGRNWDACWDCLREIAGEPIHIQIKNLEVIQQEKFLDEAQVFLDILKEFKYYGNGKYSDRTFIEIIDKDGNVTVLE